LEITPSGSSLPLSHSLLVLLSCLFAPPEGVIDTACAVGIISQTAHPLKRKRLVIEQNGAARPGRSILLSLGV